MHAAFCFMRITPAYTFIYISPKISV